ncbi:MAG: beta strand repeat-containing protein, partial [Akkermansiaceae bacterium]
MKTSPHTYKRTNETEAQRNSATCNLATCRALYLAAIAALLSISNQSAQAANFTFTGATDSAWETTSNWGGTLPGSGDDALFSADVVLTSSQTIRRINSQLGHSLTIDSGGDLTFTASRPLLNNSSSIIINSGGSLNSTTSIDLRAGGGFVTVNDGGSLDISELRAADGTLAISGSTADVTIGTLRTVDPASGGGNNNTFTANNSNLSLTSATLNITGLMEWDGASAVAIGAGSTLNLAGSGTHIITDGLVTSAGGVLKASGSGTQTLAFDISGDGAIVQDGAGSTILTGNNTFTGDTTVSQGTLAIGGSGKVGDYTGAITIASGATFEYTSDQAGSSTNRFRGGISGDGTFVVNTASGSVLSRAQTVSVANIEIKSGILNGQASADSLGTAATTIYLGDTSGSADAELRYSGSGGTYTTKAGIIVQAGSTGTKTISNAVPTVIDNTNITLNGDLTLAPRQHANNDRSLTLGGIISGTGSLIVAGVPNGTGDQGIVILSNADNNTYTGTTVVNDGILVEQVSAAVNAGVWTRTTSATTVNSGATLRLDTTNQSSAGSKQAIGTITVNAGGTLELLTEASGGNQPSIWQNGGASTLIGEGTLVKNGTGIQGVAWSGTGANNLDGFNGAIQINAGRLVFDPGGANDAGSGNSDVTVAAGAELDVRTGALLIDALDGSGTVINSGGNGSNTLSIGNNNGGGTFSGSITQVDADAFSLVKNGSGTQILSGANTYNGTTTVNAGELRIDNIESGAYTGAIIVNGGTLREVTAYNGAEQGSNTTDYARAASSTTINSGGTYVLDTSSMIDNRSRVDAGTIIVNSGGVLEIAHASTNLDTDKYIWTGGSVSGDGTIRKTGAAYADLAWSSPSGDSLDSFNGLIDVDEGTLAVNARGNSNNGGIAGSGNADLDIASGATFDLRSGTFKIDALDGSGTIENSSGVGNTLSIGNNNGSGTFSGNITQVDADAFDLVKNGTGTQILSGANTYTGTTTVSGGTLSLVSGLSHSGTGAYTVNGGTLEIATGVDLSTHAMTIAGVISPGNSPGTAATGAQTWLDGGSYLWEINDSGGTQGADSGWDWLDITGALDLTSLTAGGFTIDIDSLTLGNVAGNAAGFDSY